MSNADMVDYQEFLDDPNNRAYVPDGKGGIKRNAPTAQDIAEKKRLKEAQRTTGTLYWRNENADPQDTKGFVKSYVNSGGSFVSGTYGAARRAGALDPAPDQVGKYFKSSKIPSSSGGVQRSRVRAGLVEEAYKSATESGKAGDDFSALVKRGMDRILAEEGTEIKGEQAYRELFRMVNTEFKKRAGDHFRIESGKIKKDQDQESMRQEAAYDAHAADLQRNGTPQGHRVTQKGSGLSPEEYAIEESRLPESEGSALQKRFEEMIRSGDHAKAAEKFPGRFAAFSVVSELVASGERRKAVADETLAAELAAKAAELDLAKALAWKRYGSQSGMTPEDPGLLREKALPDGTTEPWLSLSSLRPVTIGDESVMAANPLVEHQYKQWMALTPSIRKMLSESFQIVMEPDVVTGFLGGDPGLWARQGLDQFKTLAMPRGIDAETEYGKDAVDTMLVNWFKQDFKEGGALYKLYHGEDISDVLAGIKGDTQHAAILKLALQTQDGKDDEGNNSGFEYESWAEFVDAIPSGIWEGELNWAKKALKDEELNGIASKLWTGGARKLAVQWALHSQILKREAPATISFNEMVLGNDGTGLVGFAQVISKVLGGDLVDGFDLRDPRMMNTSVERAIETIGTMSHADAVDIEEMIGLLKINTDRALEVQLSLTRDNDIGIGRAVTANGVEVGDENVLVVMNPMQRDKNGRPDQSLFRHMTPKQMMGWVADLEEAAKAKTFATNMQVVPNQQTDAERAFEAVDEKNYQAARKTLGSRWGRGRWYEWQMKRSEEQAAADAMNAMSIISPSSLPPGAGTTSSANLNHFLIRFAATTDTSQQEARKIYDSAYALHLNRRQRPLKMKVIESAKHQEAKRGQRHREEQGAAEEPVQAAAELLEKLNALEQE